MTKTTAAVDKLKETQKAAADAARDKAMQEGNKLRDRVADEGDQLADAAKAAASELDEDAPAGHILSHAGQAVEDFAAQIKETPVSHMVDDVAIFAKRNPLLFLGGAALVGFAAARFLKASPQPRADDEIDPWAGHLSSDASAEELTR